MDTERKLSVVVLLLYLFIGIFLVTGFASPYWITEKHYGNILENRGLWMWCKSGICLPFRPEDTDNPDLYRIPGGLLSGCMACAVIAGICHVVWFFRLKHPGGTLGIHVTGAALTIVAGILAACSVGVFGYKFYLNDGVLPSGWAYWMVLVCSILLMLHGIINGCSACYNASGGTPTNSFSVPVASSVYSLNSRPESSKGSLATSTKSMGTSRDAMSELSIHNGGMNNYGYSYHSGYTSNML